MLDRFFSIKLSNFHPDNGELDFEAKEIKPSNDGPVLNRFIYIEIQALMMQYFRLPFLANPPTEYKKRNQIELDQYYIDKD